MLVVNNIIISAVVVVVLHLLTFYSFRFGFETVVFVPGHLFKTEPYFTTGLPAHIHRRKPGYYPGIIYYNIPTYVMISVVNSDGARLGGALGKFNSENFFFFWLIRIFWSLFYITLRYFTLGNKALV